MIECISFLFKFTITLISKLFTIDVGFASLGVVFCIISFVFPMVLAIVNFIKTTFVEEIDDEYDYRKPHETWSFTEHQRMRTGYGKSVSSSHTRTRRRHYRL